MNVPTVLSIAVLVSAAANVLHWGGRKDEQFSYWPESDWLWFVFGASAIALLAAEVLSLARLIPASANIGIGGGMTITLMLYSIGRRRRLRLRP